MYFMKVFSKKMLVLGNDNISDEVTLQFKKEMNIAAIHRIALPVWKALLPIVLIKTRENTVIKTKLKTPHH